MLPAEGKLEPRRSDHRLRGRRIDKLRSIRDFTARRLMTDNAWAYARSRLVRQQLERLRIRHLTTKPYLPRTNGKVERFQQTMAREWAYGLVYSSHRERAAALPPRSQRP